MKKLLLTSLILIAGAIVAKAQVPAQPSTITGPTAVCLGDTVTYSVTNVQGVTYNWVLPSGWTQTSGSTTHSITVRVGGQAGSNRTITVTPSIGDSTGPPRTLTAVTVHSLPTVSLNGSDNICVQETRQLTLTPVGGSGTWASSNPSVATVTNVGVVTGVAQGTATFTFTNSTTQCRATTPAITVNPLPTLFTIHVNGTVINAGGHKGVCAGELVTIRFTGNDVHEAYCTWTNDDIRIGLQANGEGLISFVAQNTIGTPIDAIITVTPMSQNNCSCPALAESITIRVHPQFNAGAISTMSEAICFGASASIIHASLPSGGSGQWQYQWKRDDTVISNGNAPSYTPSPTNVPGFFVFTRQVMDLGCSAGWVTSSGSRTLTVLPPFTAGAISTGSQTICINDLANTIGNATPASGGDGRIRYRWIRNNVEVPNATGATHTPRTNEVGIFTYTRQARDSACNSTWTASAGSWTITVVTPFTAGAIDTIVKSVCFNASAGTILNVAPASGGAINNIQYRWMRNGEEISTATSATFVPPTNVAGAFVYTRQSKDGLCNTDWITSAGSWTLTVLPAFNPGAIHTTGQTVDINGVANPIGNAVSATGGDGNIQYRWMRDGVEIPGATGPTYTPPTNISGSFVYSREAKDGTCNGWTNSGGDWRLTVNAMFQVFIDGPNPICIGQTTQLLPKTGGTWVSNDTNVARVTNEGLVTGLASGTATFTFTIGANQSVTTPLVAVSSDRAPNINNTRINVKTDPTGMPYLLDFPNIAGNFFYQWHHNGTPIAGANSQFYYSPSGLQAGEYKVFVAYARSQSCGVFSVPYTISLPLMSTSAEWFFLYPNPSDGRFTVVFDRGIIGDSTAVTIGLFSLQGARITEQIVPAGSENFEFNENLNNGIYVLRITTNNNLSETKQIVINN